MIQFYNRKTKTTDTENVYGESAMAWAYQSYFGFFLTQHLFSKKWLSKLMGWYESSPLSRHKIPRFIEKYQINMSDYEVAKYSSFNDFFIRKFKPGLRPFSNDDSVFCAGAEARYLAFENLSAKTTITVKGIDVCLSALLNDEALAADFDGGTIIIARLCPVDYHRFHFPMSGELTKAYTVRGELHSVNPVALVAKPDIFLKNERQVAILRNEKFGKVAMIEVGALGVGKIIQSAYPSHAPFPLIFDKCVEKGYFLFGGSTVIWVLQKGKLKLSPDLASNSTRGIETWIPLGDQLGEFEGFAHH